VTMSDHGGLSLSQEVARFVDDPFIASVVAGLADICLIVSLTGKIMAASGKASSAQASVVPGWKGAQIDTLLDTASAEKLRRRTEQMRQEDQGFAPRWTELTHILPGNDMLPVRYALYMLPGRDHLLMLGHDQRPTIEMQQLLLNAQIALERDHEAQREIDTRYRLLMDFTTDAIVLISVATGQMVDVNHDAAATLGRARADLIGKPLAEFLAGQTREALMAGLEVSSAAGAAAILEAEVKSSQRKVQISGKMFRASGEQLAILRLTDPEGGSVGDQRLASNLRQLFNHGSDAIVFADRDGNILAASETFLNLTDSPSAAAVRGRSLSEFLARGVVDLRVLLENARRAGQLRMYATKLNTDFGAQIGVEVSATWLDDQFDPVLALVLRNASSAGALRPEAGGPDSNMQGVIELVGSSTLKDIVSETTDVIEKICIETALELTRNNRVAAAEMLGLSRQSLYVKLRKYGLLSKEEG
jgi:transcriptional regulator PpsR